MHLRTTWFCLAMLGCATLCGQERKPGEVASPELEKAEPLASEVEAEFVKMSAGAWRREVGKWKTEFKLFAATPTKEDQAASEAARQKILAIRDPQALGALEQVLLDESVYVVLQKEYLEPLRNIGGKGAVKLLARIAVEPRSQSLREKAAAILGEREDAKEAIPSLVKYLEGKKYRENALLALMNSELTAPTGGTLPDKQLFFMLLAILKRNDDEILNEAHFRDYYSRGSVNGQRFTGKDLDFNRAKIDALKAELNKLEPDPNVHQILTKYTGQDFEYDQLRWLDWYRDTVKIAKEHKDDLPPGDATVEKSNLDPKATAEWYKKIGVWSKQAKLVPTPAEKVASDAAWEGIAAVADPAAVPALKKALTGEKYIIAQRKYVGPIARSGGREALDFLVKLSVEPASDSLRQDAAEAIATMPNSEDAIPQYVRYLRLPKYSVYAARALSFNGLTKYRSGKVPEPQLFQALVNALILPDVTWIPIVHWYDTGSIPTGTGSGTIRFSGVSEGVVKKVDPKPNPVAEACLKEYTGQDYGYDQEKWRQWNQKERRNLEKK